MRQSESPPSSDTQPVTLLLLELRDGQSGAMDRLFPLVYEELRRIARRALRRERTGHTLATTGLVHEAYLRLVDQTRVEYQDRAHFFGIAARAMRQILVDYARRHRAAKRGGAQRVVTLEEGALALEDRAEALLALDEALTDLESVDARLGQIVQCRFFGGLTEDETAEVVGVTARTVRRDWLKAKGWLHQQLTA
ncbi:MAG TPA: ECF-type sigma factor [Gemmatimonadales bacterium]|nr:ECF-type sigma factor [Gemmatimonadales bacterium]